MYDLFECAHNFEEDKWVILKNGEEWLNVKSRSEGEQIVKLLRKDQSEETK